MATNNDILAQEVATLAAQARYVIMAALCLEHGAPLDPMERANCMLYCMEVAQDLAARAERGADALSSALFVPAGD